MITVKYENNILYNELLSTLGPTKHLTDDSVDVLLRIYKIFNIDIGNEIFSPVRDKLLSNYNGSTNLALCGLCCRCSGDCRWVTSSSSYRTNGWCDGWHCSQEKGGYSNEYKFTFDNELKKMLASVSPDRHMPQMF